MWINTLSLGRHVFILGRGHLRLESFCIQVNTVFRIQQRNKEPHSASIMADARSM